MKDALIVSLLSVFPRKRGARTMGWLARTGVSKYALKTFVKVYGINMAEANERIEDFNTLEDLFTRTLKEGVRPVDTTPGGLVAPADSRCAATGLTQDGILDMGMNTFNVHELIGRPDSGEWDCAVLYLSPKDYHRVHSPVDGKITTWSYLPGTLWPVFPAAVRKIRDLFARNERASVEIETENGPLHVVLVGAFGVGRMTLSFCDLVTNCNCKECTEKLDSPLGIGRGEELGVFHLGSTVVLVAPVGSYQWLLEPGQPVRMGQRIAEPSPGA